MATATATTTTFTTTFLTKLESQKSSLSSWLHLQKSQIDALTTEIETTHHSETERIAALLQRLEDVRVQRGLVASTDDGATKGGGVASQKRDLEEKQRGLEAKVEAVRRENAESDGVLNGELVVVVILIHNGNCMFYYHDSNTELFHHLNIIHAELLKQQAQHQEQAIASRNKKMAFAEMKNTTIDDLTKGLINYKYTGLSFEGVGNKGDLL